MLQARVDLRSCGGASEHHAQRVASGCRRVPNREARVVRTHGARPHDDGVALRSQVVGVRPRLGAGDPLAGAVRGGGAAVEGGRQLQHDERSPGAAMVEVRGEEAGGGRLRHAQVDGDPRVAEPGDPPSRHLRIGIFERDDHATDAGSDEGVGARRGAAVVRARFQGDPRGRAREVVPPGRADGRGLRVRSADGVRGAFEPGAVRGLDHAADPGVRRRRRPHRRGELEGSGHGLRVGCGGHVVSGASGAARGNDDAVDQDRPRSVLAPIRTLTVGSGISPDRPPHWP